MMNDILMDLLKKYKKETGKTSVLTQHCNHITKHYAQWLEAEISKAREKIKQLEKLTDLQNEFILKGQNILPATTEE